MNRFNERQNLMQNPMMWLTFPGLLVVLIMAWAGPTDSQGSDKTIGLLIVSGALLFVAMLFFFARLETQIDETRILLRWFPFQWRFKSINWSEIKHAELRQYKPLVEYGGWGIKGWMNNRAYNVSGNLGLQLELHSGKKILIGTRQKEALEALLFEFRQKHVIA